MSFSRLFILFSVSIVIGCAEVEENKVPVAVNDNFKVINGQPTTLDVLANDTDADEDPLTIESFSEPSFGVLERTSDGQLVFTPPSESFTGAFDFTYVVSDGTDSSEGIVNIDGVQQISITGLVTDSPIADATVLVKVGSEEFETTSDSGGRYAIDIETKDKSKMVKLLARGSEANQQSRVEFVSLAGEFETLQQKANSVGELTVDQSSDIIISNVSTAKYGLILNVLEGSEPTTNLEIADAEKSVDPEALMDLAAAIKLVVDSDFSLPSGASNTRELVLDSSIAKTFVSYLKDNYETELIDARDSIANDGNLIAGFKASDIKSQYYSAFATRPGTLSRGGEILNFKADQSGSKVNNDGVRTFTWQVADDWLDVTFPATTESTAIYLAYTSFLTEEDAMTAATENSNSGMEVDLRPVSDHYLLVQDGVESDIILVKNIEEISWPAFGSIPAGSMSRDNEHTIILRNNDDTGTIPFTTSEVIGTWGTELFYDPGPQFVFSEQEEQLIGEVIHFLSGGSFTTDISGISGTWLLENDGTISLNYDGHQHSISRIQQDGVLNGLMHQVSTSDSRSFANYNFAVKKADVTFTSNLVQNSATEFWQTLVNAWRPDQWENNQLKFDQHWGWEISSTGAMKNSWYLSNNGDKSKYIRSFDWSINGSSFSFTGAWNSFCTGTNCHTRTWTLLDIGEGGDIIYVMEQATQSPNADGSGHISYFPSRINMYQKFTRPTVDNNNVIVIDE